MICQGGEKSTYLVLTQIVGQVGDHDLGGGWDTVLGRATLLWGTWNARLLLFGCFGRSLVGLVGDIGQRKRFEGLAILASSLAQG